MQQLQRREKETEGVETEVRGWEIIPHRADEGMTGTWDTF